MPEAAVYSFPAARQDEEAASTRHQDIRELSDARSWPPAAGMTTTTEGPHCVEGPPMIWTGRRGIPQGQDQGHGQFFLVEPTVSGGGPSDSTDPFPRWIRRMKEGMQDRGSITHGESLIQPGIGRRLHTRAPNRSSIEAAFFRTLEAQPVEDGRHHPGEEVLLDAKGSFADGIDAWASDLCEHATTPAERASVMRLFGRVGLPSGTESRKALITRALASPDVEVRDAAVQAVESWEDPALIKVLEAHREAVQWLADYIDQVLDDLRQ